MKKLSDRIAFLKKVTGWKNAEVGRRGGVSRTTPTDWLSGKTKNMSAVVAERLESESGLSAIWLATGKGSRYTTENNLVDNEASWPFSIAYDQYMLIDEFDRVGFDAKIRRLDEEIRTAYDKSQKLKSTERLGKTGT